MCSRAGHLVLGCLPVHPYSALMLCLSTSDNAQSLSRLDLTRSLFLTHTGTHTHTYAPQGNDHGQVWKREQALSPTCFSHPLSRTHTLLMRTIACGERILGQRLRGNGTCQSRVIFVRTPKGAVWLPHALYMYTLHAQTDATRFLRGELAGYGKRKEPIAWSTTCPCSVSFGSLGLRHGARVCQLTSTRVPAHACWSLLYVSASGIRLYVPASGIRKHMPLLWTWSEGSMPTSSSMTMPSHIIRPCNPTHSSDACKRRRQSCNGSTLHLAMRIPHNASGSVHLGSCKFLSPFTLNPKPSPDSCAVRASPAEI